MNTEIPPEIIAQQDGNKRRLDNLAEQGVSIDLRYPYLLTLMETVADHLGVLGEVVARHEKNVADICDQAEKQAEEHKVEERKKSILDGTWLKP